MLRKAITENLRVCKKPFRIKVDENPNFSIFGIKASILYSQKKSIKNTRRFLMTLFFCDLIGRSLAFMKEKADGRRRGDYQSPAK